MEKSIPTEHDVIARLKPGAAYTANHIAVKFHLQSSDIRHLLDAMVANGSLCKLTPAGRRNKYFCLSGTPPKTLGQRPAARDDTLIAAPRTYAVLTGEIVGYESEIARRVALCMTLRRVA